MPQRLRENVRTGNRTEWRLQKTINQTKIITITKKNPNLTLLLFAFQGGSAVKSVSGSQTAIKPSRSGTVPVIF